MIRSDNLRSAFTQEDVDKYIYDLLPERDAVVKEMEAYAEEHGVPIIGPAVALDDLAGASGGDEGESLLYGRQSGKRATCARAVP